MLVVPTTEVLISHIVDRLRQKVNATINIHEVGSARVLGAESPTVIPVVLVEALRVWISQACCNCL